MFEQIAALSPGNAAPGISVSSIATVLRWNYNRQLSCDGGRDDSRQSAVPQSFEYRSIRCTTGREVEG
jgi:hypothetical protein